MSGPSVNHCTVRIVNDQSDCPWNCDGHWALAKAFLLVAAFEAGNEALGFWCCKVPRFKASMLAEFQVSKCHLAELKVSQRATMIIFIIETTLLKVQACGLCCSDPTSCQRQMTSPFGGKVRQKTY